MHGFVISRQAAWCWTTRSGGSVAVRDSSATTAKYAFVRHLRVRSLCRCDVRFTSYTCIERAAGGILRTKSDDDKVPTSRWSYCIVYVCLLYQLLSRVMAARERMYLASCVRGATASPADDSGWLLRLLFGGWIFFPDAVRVRTLYARVVDELLATDVIQSCLMSRTRIVACSMSTGCGITCSAAVKNERVSQFVPAAPWKLCC